MLDKPRRRIRIEFGAKGRLAARLACADHCRVVGVTSKQVVARQYALWTRSRSIPVGFQSPNYLTTTPSRSIMS